MRRVTPAAGEGAAEEGRRGGAWSGFLLPTTGPAHRLTAAGLTGCPICIKTEAKAREVYGVTENIFFQEVSGVAAAGGALPQVVPMVAALARADTSCPRC